MPLLSGLITKNCKKILVRVSNLDKDNKAEYKKTQWQKAPEERSVNSKIRPVKKAPEERPVN